MALVRLSRGRVSTIARATLAAGLEDGSYHRILMRRGRDGAMDVLLDGAEVLRGNDRNSLGQPFDGITIINRGGELAFRSVAVMGSAQ